MKIISHRTVAVFAALLLGAASAAASAQTTLLNVSYDPTRELYTEYNVAFSKHWKAKTGQDVRINQSHGGSGKQARAVRRPRLHNGVSEMCCWLGRTKHSSRT